MKTSIPSKRKKTKRKRKAAIDARWLPPRRSIVSLGFVLFFLWYVFALPHPLFDAPLSTVLEAADGQLLDARVAADGQWRFPMPDSLPQKYVIALTQFEDKRFFRHWGVDLRALLRAFRQNLSAGRVVSGGSTISMQLMRMSRAPKPRNLWQKLIETILATRLEWRYDKDEILRLYATHAPFGGNVVGLEAACWRYFGKKTHQISWGEAALLAVLPNSPGLLHPGRGRDKLLAKRNRLLDRLLERACLDSLEWDLAKAEPLPDKPHPLPHWAPHLLDKFILDGHEGERLRSSLQSNLQTSVLHKMNYRLASLKGSGIHNMAALVVEVATGRVLAYVGNMPGTGAIHHEQVNIIPAPRSTGSILKPFLYALALEQGLITPYSLLPDYPISIHGYRPDNYYHSYEGAVTAERALIRSLNIPMVQLLREYGVERFHHRLRKMGFSHINRSPDHYGLTLILGGAEASLWDLCKTYLGMARHLRFFAERQGQYSISDWNALRLLEERPSLPSGKLQAVPDLLSASSIWWTFSAMRRLERPNEWGEWERFSSSRPVAWKTGTSFGFRDAWAIGVTPDYLVGVWVGNADGEGRPGLVGVRAAGPVMFDLFELLPPTSWFEDPLDELHPEVLCQQSGYAALPICPKDTVLLPPSAAELKPCKYHRLIYLDASGTHRVHADCAEPGQMQQHLWFQLSPAEAYYYRRGHPEYAPLPPYAPSCSGTEETLPMQLLYPARKVEVMVPKELDGSKGKVVFKAVHHREDAQLHWFLDERYLGTTKVLHHMAVAPPSGKYLLILVDDKGYRLEREIVVGN